MRSFVQLEPFDADHRLVTSPFFSPGVLAAIRLSFAVYAFCTLSFSIVYGIVVTHDAAGFYSYFTHLTYTGLCGYFFASGLQTVFFVRRGEKSFPLQNWAKSLRFLHLALLGTITAFPILVSLVFWGVLANAQTFDTRYNAWSAISVHLLNSVFALFEIILTNSPASAWIFLPFSVVLLLGYVGIVYITYATQGFYPYAFMAPNGHPLSLALHILGVGLAETVIFVVVWCIVTLRTRLVARYMTRAETKSLASASTDDRDLEKAM